ncbi:MAG: DUF503 domain-containing protein [Spirochaetales bacterium]|jgi:uncharacterized protein|nr:DUF503 domain-containing protein [Spirochaetales bacterium]
MIVSMLQFIIEIPEAYSIKDKRRVVRSLKDRLGRKFKLSVAEVDLQGSITFAQIGAALVSNSRQFGETVLQKAVDFVEQESPGRLHDYSIYSENF